MKLKFVQKISAGFSLIETLIAIFILTMVITGPLALASQSLKAVSAAKNNFIAANLAQEGIELVRLYRTNNVLQGNSWLDDLTPPGQSENCSGSNGHNCYMDSKTLNSIGSNFQLRSCNGSGCGPFLLLDANGFYNYTSGSETIFKRFFEIDKIVNDDIVRLKVTVTWTEHGGQQSLVAEEIMLNWLLL